MRFPATRPAPAPAPLPSGPRPSSPSGSRTVGKSQAAGQMRAKRKPTRKKKLEKLLGRFTIPRHVNIWRHLYKKRRRSRKNPCPACPYQSNYLEDASQGNLFLRLLLHLPLQLPLCLSWSRRNRDKVHNISLDFLRGDSTEFQIVTMMVNLCVCALSQVRLGAANGRKLE